MLPPPVVVIALLEPRPFGCVQVLRPVGSVGVRLRRRCPLQRRPAAAACRGRGAARSRAAARSRPRYAAAHTRPQNGGGACGHGAREQGSRGTAATSGAAATCRARGTAAAAFGPGPAGATADATDIGAGGGRCRCWCSRGGTRRRRQWASWSKPANCCNRCWRARGRGFDAGR